MEYQVQHSLDSRNQLVIKHMTQDSPREALMLYRQIRPKGACFLGVVPLILKACASMSLLTYGKCLHGEAIKNGGDSDVLVATSLIDMYGKCGDVSDSRKMFDCMPERTVVTWNALIGGHIRNGDMESASRIFEEMPTRSPVTWNEMIGGFAKSGDLVKARCMFDQMPSELRNVVTWTVMVDGYASKGEMAAARALFEKMPERNFFVWSSMISGYCKIGHVKEARDIFDQIPARNLVNWNALISGYTQNGFAEEALEAFRKMQDEGFQPNEVTVVSILSACSQLGLLDVGKDIHHVLMSNIFAASDSWEEAERIRMEMVNKGLEKTLGRSSLILAKTEL